METQYKEWRSSLCLQSVYAHIAQVKADKKAEKRLQRKELKRKMLLLKMRRDATIFDATSAEKPTTDTNDFVDPSSMISNANETNELSGLAGRGNNNTGGLSSIGNQEIDGDSVSEFRFRVEQKDDAANATLPQLEANSNMATRTRYYVQNATLQVQYLPIDS